ncbi:MAG: cytochrome c oxidase subunit 3 [Bacteroidetes bacterium]|nr:cytochrome c oxidase subunit 3 [Bacteroidota bacterium]
MDLLEKESENFYYPPGGLLIWIIIFLELITFGMGIIAFLFYGKQDPITFHESRINLNMVIGVTNTFLLLTSGYFMAETVNQWKKKKQNRAKIYLHLTITGGILFITLKCIEYFQKIQIGISLDTNLFYTFYWLLTAFHLVHVLVGTVFLIFMYIKIDKNILLEDMEATAAFWHMCDLIWLLLFPTLYLIV